VDAFSYRSSLERRVALRTISRVPDHYHTTLRRAVAALHRFDESIAGRSYRIEVAAVEAGRWRACIVRVPGVPKALMPFYGRTPAEAAQLLRDWLERAHARAANSGTAV
jgi:hypothetical protein